MIQQQNEPLTSPQFYCQPQTSSRNLFWNYTRIGVQAYQSCPEGSTGQVHWLCAVTGATGTGRFHPIASPNFGQCRTKWLERVARQLGSLLDYNGIGSTTNGHAFVDASGTPTGEWRSLNAIMDDLVQLTSVRQLFSEDLKRIDIMFGQTLAQLRSFGAINGAGSGLILTQTTSTFVPATNSDSSNSNSNNVYEQFLIKLCSIVANLFEQSQRTGWLEMAPLERAKFEQQLVGRIREAALLVAQSVASASSLSLTGSAPQDDPMQYLPKPIKLPNLYVAFKPTSSVIQSIQTTSESNFDEAAHLAAANGWQLDDFSIQPSLMSELSSNGTYYCYPLSLLLHAPLLCNRRLTP